MPDALSLHRVLLGEAATSIPRDATFHDLIFKICTRSNRFCILRAGMIDPFVGSFNQYPLRQKSELCFRELMHGRVRMMTTLSPRMSAHISNGSAAPWNTTRSLTPPTGAAGSSDKHWRNQETVARQAPGPHLVTHPTRRQAVPEPPNADDVVSTCPSKVPPMLQQETAAFFTTLWTGPIFISQRFVACQVARMPKVTHFALLKHLRRCRLGFDRRQSTLSGLSTALLWDVISGNKHLHKACDSFHPWGVAVLRRTSDSPCALQVRELLLEMNFKADTEVLTVSSAARGMVQRTGSGCVK